MADPDPWRPPGGDGRAGDQPRLPLPGTALIGRASHAGHGITVYLSGFGRLQVIVDGVEVFRRWAVGFRTEVPLPMVGAGLRLRYRNRWIWYVVELLDRDGRPLGPNLLRGGTVLLWSATIGLFALLWLIEPIAEWLLGRLPW